MKESKDSAKGSAKGIVSGSDFLRTSVTVFVVVIYIFLLLKTLVF